MIIKKYKQRGAVSLFVVIFAALLIMVVTISFIRIMLKDQGQATATDLSQSAYDSAQAGVEDAKRTLLRYQSICNSGGDCNAAAMEINSGVCNAAVTKLLDVQSAASGDEVKVQTGTSNALDQAYTCVKIKLDTPDYLGTLYKDQSNIIPLKSTSEFDTVKIQWFSNDDLIRSGKTSVDLQAANSPSWPLLTQNSLAANYWKANRPPIMRTQMIQFGNNFTLNDFEDGDSSIGSNANTLFLYPTNSTVVQKDFVLNDQRKTPTGKPTPASCVSNLNTAQYFCSTQIKLPKPIGGGTARTMFLHLSAIYNQTDYRVTLLNGASEAKFNAVQPEIDSTGRANNLFRRVQTRVELTDVNFPYPQAEIDVTNSFCKGFSITDNPDDYNEGDVGWISCNP